MAIFKQSGPVHGNISLPGDKSISHRALIQAAVSMGDCTITNLPHSEDIKSTINALRSLGVIIHQKGEGELYIRGNGGEFSPPDNPINCGNSATTMRLMMGALASSPFEVELTGDESLSKRPMERMAEPLRKMGVEIETASGYAPIKMLGLKKLNPVKYDLPIGSAQVKSSLIYAAMSASGESVIREAKLSRDHTEISLENLCGENYRREIEGRIHVHRIRGPFEFPGYDMHIPGDSSSASYLIALALCIPDSEITVYNMLLNPRRIRYMELLKRMGADITIIPRTTETGEIVGEVTARYSELRTTEIGIDEIPMIIDEIPILATIATKAEGEFVLKGAEELKYKESDRLQAMCVNLKNLGYKITEFANGCSFKCGTKPHKGKIVHYGDHRILMSMIVMSIIHDLGLEFDDINPVNISFPEFREYLSLVGAI